MSLEWSIPACLIYYKTKLVRSIILIRVQDFSNWYESVRFHMRRLIFDFFRIDTNWFDSNTSTFNPIRVCSIQLQCEFVRFYTIHFDLIRICSRHSSVLQNLYDHSIEIPKIKWTFELHLIENWGNLIKGTADCGVSLKI